MDVVTLVVDTVNEKPREEGNFSRPQQEERPFAEATTRLRLVFTFSLSCSFDLLRDRLNSPIRVYVTVHLSPWRTARPEALANVVNWCFNKRLLFSDLASKYSKDHACRCSTSWGWRWRQRFSGKNFNFQTSVPWRSWRPWSWIWIITLGNILYCEGLRQCITVTAADLLLYSA